MNDTDEIRVAAKRILGRMEAFQFGPAAGGRTGAIGVYDPPGGPGPVWVTVSELLVQHGSELKELPYSQMREVHAPDSKQEGPEGGRVRLVLDDGTIAIVNIVGHRGRFLDSFGFVLFLKRASKFAREQSSGSEPQT